MKTAVFLDRDNTLIANEGDLGDPEAVRLLDGVAGGLKVLHEAGHRLIVVTNQGGVARGEFSEDDVDAVHQRIAVLVDEAAGAQNLIDRFYYCPYHPQAKLSEYRRDHPWRKPHPGMLLQAAQDLNLDLAGCWLIGDRRRDVEAASAAGCRAVLLNAEGEASDAEDARPAAVVSSFAEAVAVILKREERPIATDDDGAAPPPPAPRTALSAGPDQPRAAADNDDDAGELAALRRSMADLAEEIRAERLRRSEFTGFRLAAGLCQLLALLLALLGLLQMDSSDAFFRWMIGAALVQLLTIAILLMDPKG
ncbi:MAG: HAD family hydrolase [Planctomycetota bacterium]|nr:HAD family hydrolase [Planctomycetota bacterium]